MTYKELEMLTAGRSFPIAAVTDANEPAIICKGETFYKIVASQENGWLRCTMYWDDGTVEETYER